ncbi:hypothetical protein B0H12DRAFT_1134797 [Mycena haematopus]|nr:hypothetical protein B0H12DRAFT_1134797 [Mycena haematopus]
MRIAEANDAYLLAGSWINSMLFMLEIVLMYRYFQQPSRPLLHKVGAAVIFSFDTISTFAIWTNVYLVVLNFGKHPDPIFARSSLALLSVLLVATYATASIEQLFLCYVYFSLTKRRVVTAFLLFCVAVHLVFSYMSAIMILVNNTTFGLPILTSKIGAISCAVTDVMIAACLLFTFLGFKKTIVIRVSMQSVIHRLMILIFTSGVVVASTTLLVMIFLLTGLPAYTLFLYSQGRIYALTILYNFLIQAPSQDSLPETNTPRSIVTAVVFRSDYIGHNINDYATRSHSELTDMRGLASSKEDRVAPSISAASVETA